MEFRVKKYKNPNISRTIRFTPELFDALNQISVEQNVAFNSLVLQCCDFALSNIADEQMPRQKIRTLE